MTLSASFVAPRQDFFQRRARTVFSHRLDLGNGAADFFPTVIFVWRQVGDRFAVPGNDDRFATLDIVEKRGELGLRHRGLNLSHMILTG